MKKIFAAIIAFGLAGCSSNYVAPSDGMTAKLQVSERRYSDVILGNREVLTLNLYDVNSSNCFTNKKKIDVSIGSEILVPANKKIGLELQSKSEGDIYERSCDIHLGLDFQQGQEYEMFYEESTSGCSIIIINKTSLQVVEASQARRTNPIKGYCLAQ